MMAASGTDEHEYGYGYGPVVAVVLGLLIAGPVLLGDDGGEAVKEAVKELLGPVGRLLLPVALVVVIRVLSDFFAFGGTNGVVHRGGGGSPVGVALFLVMIVVFLYCKVSLFGGGDGDDDKQQ